MGFADAVKSVFGQYAGFSGRARRSEYWYFALFTIIVSIVLAVVDGVVGTGGIIGGVFALAVLLPGLAVTVRRLHDTDRSGWWILIGLVPLIGGIVLIVFECLDSTPDNQHGPSPKGITGGSYGAQPAY